MNYLDHQNESEIHSKMLKLDPSRFFLPTGDDPRVCVCIFLYDLVKIVFTFDIFNFQIKDDNSDCHPAKICFETRIAKMNFPES